MSSAETITNARPDRWAHDVTAGQAAALERSAHVWTTEGPVAVCDLSVTLVHEHVKIVVPGADLDPTARFDRADAIERAVDALAELHAYGVRTPLNAVIGYSEMLLDDANSHPEALVGDLRRIHGAGRHLLTLVNDVLDLSTIESGKMATQVAPIDLGRFIDDIVATAQPLIDCNKNTLVVERRGGLGSVLGDAAKLRQAVLSLLDNAAKFTKDGHITLTVGRERMGRGDWLAIAVRDTGIGFGPEKMASLFDNFTQAEPLMTRRYGGTGLGLALARKLCRLMGGDISAESVPGRGACFTLRIPASMAALATA